MAEFPPDGPVFSSVPSAPRANRAIRLLICVVLLLLACAAIWWIDRGAMLTNSRGPATAPARVHPR